MMPFCDPFDQYYEKIIKPAIKSAGLQAVRADDLFRPSPIVSDIWGMIQKAHVLVAELTTKNANVFYELGLAHAIGKPVILLSESMADVPFDLQQLRILLYDRANPQWGAKLARDIKAAVQETLDSPIESVPDMFRKIVKSKAPVISENEARLERLESQMRALSRYFEPTREIEHPLVEIRGISSTRELEEWYLRWLRRGVGHRMLGGIIKGVAHVPDSESARLSRKYRA